MKIDPEMTISEALKKYPGMIKVFIKRKMLCIGCPAQAYHTLKDAARFYSFTECDLMESLTDAVQVCAGNDKTGKEVKGLKISEKIKKKGGKHVSAKN